MTYKSIAVAVDGSATSDIALIEAIHFAKQVNAPLSIIHVLDELVTYDLSYDLDLNEFFETIKIAGKKILAESKTLSCMHNVHTETYLIENLHESKRISERLSEAVENLPADILVMGTHGRRGFNEIFLGSVALQTIHICSAPILLIGPNAKITESLNQYQKIVAAVDDNEISRLVLAEAINLCKVLKAKLELIHIVNELPTRFPVGFHLAEEQAYLKNQGQLLLDEMSELATTQGVMPNKKLIEIKREPKTISQAILEEMKLCEADLLITGTRGLKGLNRFLLGSVTADIIHTSSIPILVIGSKVKKIINY